MLALGSKEPYWRLTAQTTVKNHENVAFARMGSPKNEKFLKNTHPQEFVSSLEQIWRSLALYHLLTNGSSAVNGCRQNGSLNSWLKTSQ